MREKLLRTKGEIEFRPASRSESAATRQSRRRDAEMYIEAHDLLVEENFEFLPRDRFLLQVEIEEVGRERRCDWLVRWIVYHHTRSSA